MILSGGTSSKGYVFQFDPVNAHFQAVFSFDGTNGAQPSNGLVQGENGKLYRVVDGGDTNDIGVIFAIDLSTLTETFLYNMDASVGASRNSLLYANDGNLYYGLSSQTYSYGIIVSYNPSTLKDTIASIMTAAFDVQRWSLVVI